MNGVKCEHMDYPLYEPKFDYPYHANPLMKFVIH